MCCILNVFLTCIAVRDFACIMASCVVSILAECCLRCVFGRRFEIGLGELHSASPVSICIEFGRVSKASFVHPAVWSSSQVVARLGSWNMFEFQGCIGRQ